MAIPDDKCGDAGSRTLEKTTKAEPHDVKRWETRRRQRFDGCAGTEAINCYRLDTLAQGSVRPAYEACSGPIATNTQQGGELCVEE